VELFLSNVNLLMDQTYANSFLSHKFQELIENMSRFPR